MLIIFTLSGCDKEQSSINESGDTPEPTAASEVPEPSPELPVKITVDGEEIEVLEYSSFSDYLYKYPELPYTEPDSLIEISFTGAAPDRVKVSDLWIACNGREFYDYAKEQSPKLTESDGVYSFVVFINFSVGLDSIYRESILRGFEVVCKYGENYKVYRFVLLTGSEWTANTIPDSYARDKDEE
jgi:hypothetical protein